MNLVLRFDSFNISFVLILTLFRVLVGCLAGRLADWLSGWLAGWLVGRSAGSLRFLEGLYNRREESRDGSLGLAPNLAMLLGLVSSKLKPLEPLGASV